MGISEQIEATNPAYRVMVTYRKGDQAIRGLLVDGPFDMEGQRVVTIDDFDNIVKIGQVIEVTQTPYKWKYRGSNLPAGDHL